MYEPAFAWDGGQIGARSARNSSSSRSRSMVLGAVIQVLGLLWALAAVGFVVAAAALVVGWSWWLPLAVGVAAFSLILTSLDVQVAYAGLVVNVLVLVGVWVAVRVVAWTG